jgi:hypothetical protein
MADTKSTADMQTTTPTLPPGISPGVLEDPRSKRIIAKTIYRELRSSGLGEKEVLAIATELLGLVAEDLRDR